MIEPNTLIVESTDSSLKDVCATLLCGTRGVICANRLCLALEQSHKHLLNVLHQSLPVPQSNAYSYFIDLLGDFLSMWDWLCHEPLHQSVLAINTRSSVDIFLIVIPSIFLALSRRLVPNQAKFLVLSL